MIHQFLLDTRRSVSRFPELNDLFSLSLQAFEGCPRVLAKSVVSDCALHRGRQHTNPVLISHYRSGGGRKSIPRPLLDGYGQLCSDPAWR